MNPTPTLQDSGAKNLEDNLSESGESSEELANW